jgi:peptidoglycan/xylan/chitin deacetylase (PgdA/CDA1 family)
MKASRLLAAGVAGLAVAHALPAVTALSPVRQRLFGGLSGLGAPGHVALTFDDGPDPVGTRHFLRVLDARGVTATFFLLGRMAEASPDIVREIVHNGHEIGLHGYTHRCLLARGPKSTMDDLTRGRDVLAAITGEPPRWYRPPYGVLTTATLAVAARLNLRPVLWTAWGRDWTRSATPESIFETVHKGLSSGGTILLHDSDCTSTPGSWRMTLAALPALLDYCADREWRVGPLREHGLTMQSALAH